jgi:VWFA-related protein
MALPKIFRREFMFRFQRSVAFVLVVALLSGAPVPRFAQQSNQDVVRISTQLVQVDAVVTDKKGRHVEDLTEADFELLVDGKKQPLTHFSRISLPGVNREPAAKKKADLKLAPESMPTRQIAPEEVRRAIAFIVDDLGLTFQSTSLVRETLKTFVSEQMQEGDLVAIIRTGNGLGMLEQFTSDKRLLYTAIEKLMWNPLSRDMMPSFDDTSGAFEADESAAEQQAEQQAVLDSFEEFRETSFTTGTLGAINWVVRNLRFLPGRKSVILLSDGFRINPPSSSAGSMNSNDNNAELIMQSLRNLIEQANRSSVVIYSIDAKGLQPYLPGANVGGRPSASAHSDALQSAQEALEGPSFLAQQTGGFAVFNTNDLNIGIEEALYDQQSYYLLGFDPEDEKFDRRFHSIKVKVTRPGVKVRTRSGFFGVNEDERREPPKTRGQQILSALLSPLGKRELSLRMTPFFFNSTKEGPLVRALFHIDCSKLTFKDGPKGEKLLNLDLAAFVFDEEGMPIDLAARRLNLSFDEKQYRQALAHGLAYRADFPLRKPGAYQFRAVLRDGETGRAGSASQFIQAPDLSKNRLALSGLVLTTPKTAPAGDNVSSNEAVAAVAANATPERAEKEGDRSSQPGDLQATPYLRRFPRTGWIQYGAAIYNATADKKTGQPQITVRAEIYRDGKPAYQFPARSLEFSPGVNPKRFDYVGRLRLKDFPAGDYLLRLIITDGLAKKKFARAEQWMDFSVK